MNKTLIAALTAALLLAAVICTAGCIDTKTTDPVIGDWFAENDTTVSFVTFAEDNTGYFITGLEKSSSSETESGYSESSSSEAAASTFKWTAAEPRKTYTLTFGDGTIKTASLEAQRGVMTIDGVEFEKMSSAISGVAAAHGYAQAKLAELRAMALAAGVKLAKLDGMRAGLS